MGYISIYIEEVNMFSYIKGDLVEKNDGSIVVECGGIGYMLFISEQFAMRLPAIGAAVKVYTYMYIREDELSLYGFADNSELETFKLLISINGIGPKAALSVLSAMSVSELQFAVVTDDVKSITKANGVGTKGAQRIIMELKDKMKMEDLISGAYDRQVTEAAQSSSVTNEVILALTSLGYSGSEAAAAIKKVKNVDDMSTEQLLSAALKKIM